MSPKEETKRGSSQQPPTKKGQNFQLALTFGGLVIAITAHMTKGAPPKANEQVLVSPPKQAKSPVSPPKKAKSPVSTPTVPSTIGSDTAQPPYLALAQWDPGAPPEISDTIPASWTDQRKADTYGCEGKRLFEGEANSKAAAFKLAGLAQGRCVIWQTNGHLAIYDGLMRPFTDRERATFTAGITYAYQRTPGEQWGRFARGSCSGDELVGGVAKSVDQAVLLGNSRENFSCLEFSPDNHFRATNGVFRADRGGVYVAQKHLI